MQQAVALYRGDFLDDFHIADAPVFTDWVLLERERLRQSLLDALAQLADHAYATQAYDDGIHHARRALTLDPWLERAHQQLMRLLAAHGQRSKALAQFETCRRILAEEFGVEPAAETVALYEAIRDDRMTPPQAGMAAKQPAAKDAAVAVPPAPLHNIPAATTPFIGREEELVQLQTLLADPTCRLLTIVGPGGMGKTRLGLETAVAQLPHFPDGVYLVSLAAAQAVATEINPLVSAVAAVLAFSFSGSAPPAQQLLNFLRPKHMLLLLDNVEHLVPHTGWLVTLLEQAPYLKLLVTSRESLNLYEEWVFDLRGLPYPAEAGVADAIAYSAVQLFAQRARRVNLRFALQAELEAVVTICRLLQGMPLAIELAAAWARTLPCDEVAAEIRRNLDFLAAHWRNLPERHRSLRAVFTHSWQLLADEERQALARLAVFAGGFTAVAAAAIAGADRRVLSRLVDKSLVQRGVDGRYRLHELMRQFAQEQQHDDAVQQHHARFYAQWLRQQEQGLDFGEMEVIHRVGQEFDNLMAAWQWAVAQQQTDVLAMALRGMCSYWEIRGRFREGEQVLQQALVDLTAVSDYLRACLQAHQGRFNYIMGTNLRAKELLQESLSLLAAGAYPAERAMMLTNLALARNSLGESAAAEIHARDSLALFTDLGDLDGQAAANNNIGFVLTSLGHYDDARPYLRTSIAQYTQLGNQRGRVKPLNLLGSVCNARGDYEQARQFYVEGLAIGQALQDRWVQASFLVNLCVLAKKQAQYEEAWQSGQQSLAIFRELGEQRGTAVALKNLGDIACARQQWEQAQALYEESLAIRRAIGDRFGEALDQHALAAWALAQQKYTQAWRYLRPAYKLAAAIQAPALQVYMLPTAAALWLAEGDVLRATAVARLAFEHPMAEAVVREQAQHVLAQLDDPPPAAPSLTLADLDDDLIQA
ncbi:MAG: tetratricopeptide repeat protein [Chloroflexota bacterium]